MKTTDRTMGSHEQIAGRHWADSLWFRILLITALGLGIFFRVAGLGNKIYSHDEAYTSLYAAGYPVGDVFNTMWDGKDKTAGDIRQFLKPGKDKDITDTLSVIALSGPQQTPLFYLLAYYWMRLIDHTPAAMRALAAIFGILSIPAMYWFSRELFRSSPTALVSTALFAVSPFHILFAQDARSYSLWTLVTILSSAALLGAMRKDRVIAWLIYSLTLILGIYSHQLFLLVIIVHGLYFIVTRPRKDYVGFLSASLLAFLAYLPWLFLMITRWRVAARQLDWLNIQFPWYRYIQRWLLIFSSPFIDLDFQSANIVAYALRALMLLFIAYTFLFLLRHASRQQWMFILMIYIITAGTLIVPDLFLGGMRSIAGRYFVPANIATILVVAYFLSSILDQSNLNTITTWKLLVGLLMAAGILSNINSLLAKTWWNKELSRIQPELIHMINKDNAVLIVSSYQSTNLGDVLSMSLEIESDVNFRLYKNSDDLEFPDNYDYVYWFPGSSEEVQRISEKKGLQVREVLKDTLWQIEGKVE